MEQNFDINNIVDVLVKYQDGTQALFRGKGLEKLRKLMKTSPPLQLTDPAPKKPKQIIVEESGSEGSSSEEEPSQPPPSKKKKTKVTAPVNGGYNTVHLDYKGQMAANTGGPAKGLSPHDLAKEMQRQATASSGIQYS